MLIIVFIMTILLFIYTTYSFYSYTKLRTHHFRWRPIYTHLVIILVNGVFQLITWTFFIINLADIIGENFIQFVHSVNQ